MFITIFSNPCLQVELLMVLINISFYTNHALTQLINREMANL